MTAQELDQYTAGLTADQTQAIHSLRQLILHYNPGLTERVNPGKWLTGLIIYCLGDGPFIYALGPRPEGMTTLHMMPYYGSAVLREKHGAAFKKFETGKSCILFKKVTDLPQQGLIDVIDKGTKATVEIIRARMKKPGKK